MKKIAVLLCAVLALMCLTACGSDTKKTETNKTDSVDYISKSEAKIFFYEITSSYCCELLLMNEEELGKGVEPEYWPWLADAVESLSYADLKADYITDDEKAALAAAYGAQTGDLTFDIYRIADLQKGIDTLYGEGRCDASTWNGGNLDIVSNNAFGTGAGYFLTAETNDRDFDTQIYKIISVKPGKGEAVVRAYAVGVDNIKDNIAYDISVVEQSTDEAGNVTESYKTLTNAAVDQYDYGAEFDANMTNMGIDESSLGTIEFVLGVNGISIYLDHTVSK